MKNFYLLLLFCLLLLPSASKAAYYGEPHLNKQEIEEVDFEHNILSEPNMMLHEDFDFDDNVILAQTVACTHKPFTPRLVQESSFQYLLSWQPSFNQIESVTITITFTLCSGQFYQETATLPADAPRFYDFVINPAFDYSEISGVVTFHCSDGTTSPDSEPAIFAYDCGPCTGYMPEISFNCNRDGLLCVVIDEDDQSVLATSIYQVCEIGGNGHPGACYDIENLPDGAETLSVVLCEYNSGGCASQACCISVDVPVPACADDCPEVPFTFDWCCNIDPRLPACLCATDADGKTYQVDQLPDGYWIPRESMNIPGICIYNTQLPPVTTPVTFTVFDAGNNCSYTIEMSGPDCWGIEGDRGIEGGRFKGESVDGRQKNGFELKNDIISIFPNPVNDIVRFENTSQDAVFYEIMDAQGKVLNSGK